MAVGVTLATLLLGGVLLTQGDDVILTAGHYGPSVHTSSFVFVMMIAMTAFSWWRVWVEWLKSK